MTDAATGASVSARLRRALLVILALGLVGTAAELLLLGHYEDAWQVVPVALLPLSLAALVWRGTSSGGAARAAFRGAMGLCLLAGLVGTFLHYRGNAEFELEMAPDITGWPLFAEAMTGATPALAPGAMILFGLIGLATELAAGPTRPHTQAEDTP